MILTTEQRDILNELESEVLKFNSYRDQFITTVGGYAGTGKTTLICELRKRLKKRTKLSVAFLTFTGKASSVLKLKLAAHKAFYHDDYIGTIHGLIYKPETIWDKTLNTYVILGWRLRDKEEVWPDLFIIDEASMVSKSIFCDLLRFEKPIIAFGDHGQLPPISDDFNLMDEPEFKLTEIHRQALNSPIIKLSKLAREDAYIPSKIYSPEVFKLPWDHKWCKKLWDEKIDFTDNIIVLCGFNTTRANLNDKIRKKLGYKKEIPYPGEKVVCLKNNHYADIMNGQIGEVIWVMPENEDLYRITLDIDSNIYEVLIAKRCFGEVQYTMYKDKRSNLSEHKYASEKGFNTVSFFDYGYTISVHKSQGAEWDRVILFEQRSKHWDDEYYSRWLYTAVTRSREKLMIVENAWI